MNNDDFELLKKPRLGALQEKRKNNREACSIKANYMVRGVGTEAPSKISVTVLLTSEPSRGRRFPLERVSFWLLESGCCVSNSRGRSLGWGQMVWG